MTLPDLPDDRRLTPAEQRGFNMACSALMRWGALIEREGVSLGGTPVMVPQTRMMQHGGRMVRHCADALSRSIGQNRGARGV